MESIISLRNVSVFNSDEVLLSIDKFTIPKNSFYCIVGESGGGKSLLSKLVLGILPQRLSLSGEITNFAKQSELILQDPRDNLQLFWTVEEQGHHILRSQTKWKRQKRQEMIKKSLLEVGLTNLSTLLRKNSFELSGGMCQRVAIAFSLLSNPDFIVADEPTSALDPKGRIEILTLLKQQWEKGKTILFITHDLELIANIATHITILKSGRIVESGTVQQIVDQPKENYTKELFSYFETNSD
ncbi:ATP-binding cassette domain-containing protein [Streptococcus cameli]